MSAELTPEVIQIATLIQSLIHQAVSEQRPPQPAPKDEELTVRQVAKLKGVSDRTVRTWITQKKVASHKTPGGGVRIYQSEIDKAV